MLKKCWVKELYPEVHGMVLSGYPGFIEWSEVSNQTYKKLIFFKLNFSLFVSKRNYSGSEKWTQSLPWCSVFLVNGISRILGEHRTKAECSYVLFLLGFAAPMASCPTLWVYLYFKAQDQSSSSRLGDSHSPTFPFKYCAYTCYHNKPFPNCWVILCWVRLLANDIWGQAL